MQHYRNVFIDHPVTGLKLRLQAENAAFFQGLLVNRELAPATDGQERLLRAYTRISQRVRVLSQEANAQELLKKWLSTVSGMEVLEFIERDEGKAIRMFQSVNDRGVPLVKMDIVKSLLIYYSNRYLNAELDIAVSESIGRAYRSFSRVKRLAGKEDGYKVRAIARDAFREDDVLRYHYLAFDGTAFGVVAGADYNATTETVLEVFLKPTLRNIRSNPAQLREFIVRYTEDLQSFFGALEQLIEGTRADYSLYRLFVIQDLSATLYPLVIRLQLQNLLSQVDSARDTRDLKEFISMVDLRVFKLRGTNPQADIVALTHDLSTVPIGEVIDRLRRFASKFMPDTLMLSRLADEDLYRNPGAPIILLAAEESARTAVSQNGLTLNELANMNRDGLTVEHILPQEPSFNVTAYGFATPEEYLQHIHRIGNLTLLESRLNSRCNNRTVTEKMSNQDLYAESQLTAVAELRADRANRDPMFDLNAIASRSTAFADMVARRWPITG